MQQPCLTRASKLLFLLLLSSQLDLWGSPFWVTFLQMWPFKKNFFFNPTTEVVKFRLGRWCMLGVFLLPAFTRSGHKRQDLLKLCDGMHVCTDQILVYTLIWKSFGGIESEPMLTPREKSPLPEKNYPQRRTEPMTLHQAGQQAQHTTNKLFHPQQAQPRWPSG